MTVWLDSLVLTMPNHRVQMPAVDRMNVRYLKNWKADIG